MTNFEKHKNEIIKIIETSKSGIVGIKDGILVPCNMINCIECNLNIDGSDCIHNFIKWLYEDDGEVGIDTRDCNSCKYTNKTIHESPCSECRRSYPDKFEPKLEKKTRQDEFLELYPNVKKCYGVVDICPKDLDKHFYCRSQELLSGGCITCCQDYWFQEVEE